MISIGFVSAGGGRYYTDLAREDYYLSGGESPGQWFDNSAAKRFGLAGTVERTQLENLFDGYDAAGSKALVQNAGDETRRAAVDVCFSVPKDYSTLWAVASNEDRKRLEAAFHRAVDRALEHINERCGWTRRGQGGYDREKVDLLVAKFTHRSSRAQDPQLHCHALVMNACQRADGTFGTIDAKELLAAKKSAGAYFRSALAHELNVPLERDPDAAFSFRISGTPKGLSDHWSTRSKAILDEIKEQGVTGARAKALAALSTREVKGHRALAELREEWGKQALEHGFSREDAGRILNTRRQEHSPEEAKKVVDAAIEACVKELTKQDAHFTRDNLLKDTCIATVDRGIAPELVAKQIDRTLKEDRFIALDHEKGRYTTRLIYEEVEGRALSAAKRMGETTSRPVADEAIREALDAAPRPLNPGQRDAATKILKGPDLVAVQGPPGSGKTTMLNVVRDALERDGARVIGLTPTNRAARELKDGSGIECYTIHRFLHDQERAAADGLAHRARMLVRAVRGLPTSERPKIDVGRNTTIVVDECSMADNEKLSKVLAHAERQGCRVVLIGDSRQLPAIGQGGLFREVHERATPMAKAELTEIVRQKEGWARAAIQSFGKGEIGEALQAYEERGFVRVAGTRAEAMDQLAHAWAERGVKNPKDHLMLAPTNAEVDALNDRAQATRKASGELGWKSVTVGKEQIHEGERVLFTENKKKLGIVNSEFGTVLRVDPLRNRLTVAVDGADVPVTFSLHQFDGVRRGYAATVHRAQGMTLDQDAYILFGGTTQSREMTYVQISRARASTHIFADRRTTPDVNNLERQARRSAEKASAHTIAREAQQRQEQQQSFGQGLNLSL